MLDVEIAPNGVWLGGKLHPFLLDADSVARADPTGQGLDAVRRLSDEDFPQSGVRVAPDGTLTAR
jgi:hypothetical protein